MAAGIKERQVGQMTAYPRRGSEEVKLTRVRRSRTTWTLATLVLQEGQVAGASRAYSASGSTASGPWATGALALTMP